MQATANLQTCTDHQFPLFGCARGPQLPPLLFFFFILTLVDCGEIMKTLPYGGEPALHIVVLAALNCPSGPFRP